MTKADAELGTGDREQLEALGIPIAEAERQIRLLAKPPRAPKLLRPCRLEDGIRALDVDEQEALGRQYRAAVSKGCSSKFVPASGAASRMFKGLLSLMAEQPSPSAAEVARRLDDAARDGLRLLDELNRMPFSSELEQALAASGAELGELLQRRDSVPVISALLGAEGLALARRPKGLLPFHRYEDMTRTAFEEQLVEGRRYLRDEDGVCRFHFTVSPHHLSLFETVLDAERVSLESRQDVRLEVGFSVQSAGTDTLALGVDGGLLRRRDGSLVLRPSGHGALIDNLSALEGDIVFVKNIDNVLPESRHELIRHWKEVLGGYVVRLRGQMFDVLERLRGPHDAAAIDDGLQLLRSEFGIDLRTETGGEELASRVAGELDRPLRVCAMVPNTGEPGGGPFWVVDDAGRSSLQIIERAQVDDDSDDQLQIFAAATHFNPVDIVCGVRDWQGRPFDLRRFVDQDAVFIANKSEDGREIKALERPGLWNGAMAGWRTVFVEVPIETFAPVKTVFDLLRPEHQE